MKKGDYSDSLLNSVSFSASLIFFVRLSNNSIASLFFAIADADKALPHLGQKEVPGGETVKQSGHWTGFI